MKKKPIPPKIKLDLSFGDLPQGHPFIRVPGLDALHPSWKLANESVEEAYSAYLLNRIPGKDRLAWMDEVYRILIPSGKLTVIVPYWHSARSVQDPLSEWPPMCEQSFLYFNKKFREDNKWPSEAICDFDFAYGYSLDQETQLRTDDSRPFWIKHYCNSVADVQLVLTKRP